MRPATDLYLCRQFLYLVVLILLISASLLRRRLISLALVILWRFNVVIEGLAALQ